MKEEDKSFVIIMACINEKISDLLEDLECDINNIIVEELKKRLK